MKLTKSKLKQLIKEELNKVLKEGENDQQTLDILKKAIVGIPLEQWPNEDIKSVEDIWINQGQAIHPNGGKADYDSPHNTKWGYDLGWHPNGERVVVLRHKDERSTSLMNWRMEKARKVLADEYGVKSNNIGVAELNTPSHEIHANLGQKPLERVGKACDGGLKQGHRFGSPSGTACVNSQKPVSEEVKYSRDDEPDILHE